jgi:2-polyprenyl-3-methyl-5-hydroxy-6-metoxy-1,4-benzoquinol methylase
MNYYGNVNPDLLDKIPVTAKRVLEVGCGSARLGEAFKARSPDSQYFGIELFESAAKEAARVLDGVICANIEQDTSLALKLCRSFDTLVFGDVLEHLQDPWKVLAELRQYIEPGGSCIACVPNVAHWSLVSGLLQGNWEYQDSGLLDRTHLRFFTLDSAIQMLQKAGWTVVDATPRNLWPEKTEAALKDLLPAAHALGVDVLKARQNMSALQWVIRAINDPNSTSQPRLSVAALGYKKMAGVTEARVDHPMKALNSLHGVSAVWNTETLSLSKEMTPGVLVLHRQFMVEAAFNEAMEKLVAKGWTLVADIDDDPHHWSQYVESNFYAFRSVHAVTVSSEHLADIIREFNPNVQVFENAILSIPHRLFPEVVAPDAVHQRLRIFFGALNRKADWLPIIEGINQAATELKDTIEFVVVHDKEFHDALPETVAKSFMPTLGIEKYIEVLANCDIALLPLNDTPFNRSKSDIKLIECASAQVAVICSEAVYAIKSEHQAFVLFAKTQNEWRDAITRLAQNKALRQENVAKALAYVKARRMHSQQAPQRIAFYANLVRNRNMLEQQRQNRISGMAK